MNIALVHELLTMRGGAERTLRVLAAMFPEAPIYTLLYDESKLGDWFPASRVRTSNLQKYTALTTNHHFFLPFFPRAVEAWDFSAFDLVISSSSAFAHGIITNGKPKHLCYVHSPARYLWDRTHDVLNRSRAGPFGPIVHAYLSRVFHRLRVWDAEVAPRPDTLIAASEEVRRRIELYWQRESEVIYPPIDDFWLTERATSNEQRATDRNGNQKINSYFLIASTLAPYKRIDLAIEACNRLRVPLKIVGEGRDRRRLERMAGPSIEFLGYRDQEQLKELYTNATATIFPGDEDFGLVPIESMACGTPVIAYRAGGALETIVEGKTGVFFDQPTGDSLQKVLNDFRAEHFGPQQCRDQVTRFSRSMFEKAIMKKVAQLTEGS